MKTTSVMIYGPSSSTKTSQCYFMAKWLYEKFNLKTRLITTDPGGYAPFVDSGLIEKGVVDVFDFTKRDLVLADFRRLSKGYWPKFIKNDKGEIVEYFRTDENCLTTDKEWEEIGMVCIDGMTHAGEILKSHCVQRPGNTVGFKESWEYEEDGEVIRGAQMGHYGIVQDEMLRRHREGFNNLPVRFLVWTALVGQSEERQSKDMVYGPQLVGNKTTPYIPSWFNHCLHLDTATLPKLELKNGQLSQVDGETEVKKVAWFTEHVDNNTGIKYLCKSRLMPEMVPELLRYFPFGCVPLGFKGGIEKYFMVLEKLKVKDGGQ